MAPATGSNSKRMAPRLDLDSPEQNIRRQDIGWLAVDRRPPPGVPHVIEHDVAAAGRVRADLDDGVLIAGQPRDRARTIGGAAGGRRHYALLGLQQNGAA